MYNIFDVEVEMKINCMMESEKWRIGFGLKFKIGKFFWVVVRGWVGDVRRREKEEHLFEFEKLFELLVA